MRTHAHMHTCTHTHTRTCAHVHTQKSLLGSVRSWLNSLACASLGSEHPFCTSADPGIETGPWTSLTSSDLQCLHWKNISTYQEMAFPQGTRASVMLEAWLAPRENLGLAVHSRAALGDRVSVLRLPPRTATNGGLKTTHDSSPTALEAGVHHEGVAGLHSLRRLRAGGSFLPLPASAHDHAPPPLPLFSRGLPCVCVSPVCLASTCVLGGRAQPKSRLISSRGPFLVYICEDPIDGFWELGCGHTFWGDAAVTTARSDFVPRGTPRRVAGTVVPARTASASPCLEGLLQGLRRKARTTERLAQALRAAHGLPSRVLAFG